MPEVNPDGRPIPTWRDTLRRGQIASFAFPAAEPDATGREAPRPCLVLDVESRGAHLFATLACGAPAATATDVEDEIHVVEPAAMAAAGVTQPTRFVAARRLTVSLEHPGWDLDPASGAPMIGRLDAASETRLDELWAKLRARREAVAARRRGARRVTVERGPSERAEVVVEHRRRRTGRAGKAVL